MANWTELLKHIDFAIKYNENYTNLDFNDLIEKVQKVLDEMPEAQNRKLKLLGKLNKLQLIRVEKEASQ